MNRLHSIAYSVAVACGFALLAPIPLDIFISDALAQSSPAEKLYKIRDDITINHMCRNEDHPLMTALEERLSNTETETNSDMRWSCLDLMGKCAMDARKWADAISLFTATNVERGRLGHDILIDLRDNKIPECKSNLRSESAGHPVFTGNELTIKLMSRSAPSCYIDIKQAADSGWRPPNVLMRRTIESRNGRCEYSIHLPRGQYEVAAQVPGAEGRTMEVTIDDLKPTTLAIDFDRGDKHESGQTSREQAPATAPRPPPPPPPRSSFRLTVSLAGGGILESFGTPLTFLPEDPDTLPVGREGSAELDPIALCGGNGRCVYRETEKLTDHFSGLAVAFAGTIDAAFVRDSIDFGITLGILPSPGAYRWYGGPRVGMTIRNWRVGFALLGGASVYEKRPKGERVWFSEPAYRAVWAEKDTVVEARSGPQGGLRLEIEYLWPDTLGPGTVLSFGSRPTLLWSGDRHYSFVFPIVVGVGLDFLGDEPAATPKKEVSP